MSLSIYFYLTLYCIIIGQYLSFGQSDLTLPVNAISAFKMNEAGNALFQISNTSEQHPNNGNSINVDDENINDNMSKQNKKSSFSIPDKLRLLWFDHRIPYYLMKPILGGQSGNPSAYVYQNGEQTWSEPRARRLDYPEIRSQSFLRFGRMNKRPTGSRNTAFIRFGRQLAPAMKLND